ncbi:MAG: rhamnulokinase [archaeon]|nr:rhamnulokinase [archaeon]
MELNNKFRAFALDMGASSIRAILGVLDSNKKLKLEVLHRFPNKGVQVDNSLIWDVSKIWKEILNSMKIYVKKYGSKLECIALDTWGVDYALLNENDELVDQVYHYRDKRTDNLMEEMFKIVPKEEIFNQTGLQFMQLNTIVQLYSLIHNKSPHLSMTKTLLMLPDYFNFLLSGKKSSEYSIATTTQLYDPRNKKWATDLIKRIGLNPNWFLQTIKPGTILGKLKRDIADDVGLKNDTNIVAVACHDTASAIAAVPVNMNKYSSGEWAYLSSGTWSIIGVELEKPIINYKVLKYNFTNEGGINGTIRFLKNITGLWLIQECKKIWDKNGLNLSWDDIAQQANTVPEFQIFIDPMDDSFMNPPNMVEAIKAYCINHDQSPPEGVGQMSRAIFESLAFKYKQVMENLEELIKKKIQVLHIFGGGSQNDTLNQFTANVLNIPVMAGPIEATAIGNILIQAQALNKIKDVSELREIVRKSFPIKEFMPIKNEKWENAYKRYLDIL